MLNQHGGKQMVAYCTFDATTGTVRAAQSAFCAIALVGANQQWNLSLAANAPGGTFLNAPNGLFQVRVYIESASGATARVPVYDITPGTGLCLIESIDPATGLLANAAGDISVEVWRPVLSS